MKKSNIVNKSSTRGYEVVFNKRVDKKNDEQETIERRIQRIKKQLYGSNASVERILERSPADIIRAYIIQCVNGRTASRRKKRRN